MADTHIDTQSGGGGVKKPRRHRRNRPGKKALKEIKYYQVTEKTLIPVAVMQRAVRHILAKWQPDGARIKPDAFKALHAGVEDYATTMFKGTQLMAIHANRQTIMQKDLRNLTRVCTVMSGAHDLETEPINSNMSEHHKRKKKSKKSSSSARATKKTPSPAVVTVADESMPVEADQVILPVVEEIAVEVEVEQEEEVLPMEVQENNNDNDGEYSDEWLLSND